jgi:tetratricopeptide (TPR) repeat protein
MSETFQSEYITFELSYLLVKLFAVRSQWVDLLETAESLRSEFPQKQRREVEMLMVQSLINLNQYSRADSLLSSLYTDTGDTSALLEWADLEVLTEDYASALAKYQAVYAAKPGSDIWLKMLKTSTALAFDGFEVLWQMGEVFLSEVPQALLLRLEYLVADAKLEEASGLTDQIIANSLNTYDHATAFLYKGIIAYENSDFGNAISELRKVLMLFSDIPDIVDKAAYQLIKTYLQMGAYTDASMLFWQYAPRMSEVNIRVINQLLEEQQ